MGSRLRQELRRDRYSNVRTSIANDSRRLNYYSGEDDSDDEARREEEQERALSELHGEASEGAAGEKRKKETDEEVAKQLNNEGRRKRARITLTPKHLMEANGIIRIPIDFANAVRYHRKKRDVTGAAAYSNRLINAYRNFCEDIFPGMAFEDVLLKIEQLGSKKEVKGFLKEMRNSERNKRVESLYGKEKAEKMISELENGLSGQLSEHLVNNAQDNQAEEPEEPLASDTDEGTAPSNESSRNPEQGVETSSDLPVVSPNQDQQSPTPRTDTSRQSVAKPLQDDDDDEDEATFDDVLGFQDKLANATKDAVTSEHLDSAHDDSAVADNTQSTTASGTQDNPQSVEYPTEKSTKDEGSDEEATFEDVLAVQDDELTAKDASVDDLTSTHHTKGDQLDGKEVPLLEGSDTGATESLDDTTSENSLDNTPDMHRTATSEEQDSSSSSMQPTESAGSQKESANDEESDDEEEAASEDALCTQDQKADAESEQIGTTQTQDQTPVLDDSPANGNTASDNAVAPSSDNVGQDKTGDLSSHEDTGKVSDLQILAEIATDSGSSSQVSPINQRACPSDGKTSIIDDAGEEQKKPAPLLQRSEE